MVFKGSCSNRIGNGERGWKERRGRGGEKRGCEARRGEGKEGEGKGRKGREREGKGITVKPWRRKSTLKSQGNNDTKRGTQRRHVN